MRPHLALLAVGCWLAFTAIATGGAQAPRPAASSASAASAHQRVLGSYCVTCHNERLRTGGLSLLAIATEVKNLPLIFSAKFMLASVLHGMGQMDRAISLQRELCTGL